MVWQYEIHIVPYSNRTWHLYAMYLCFFYLFVSLPYGTSSFCLRSIEDLQRYSMNTVIQYCYASTLLYSQPLGACVRNFKKKTLGYQNVEESS